MHPLLRSRLAVATALATFSILTPATASERAPVERAPVSGIDISAMDKSVRPQDDFSGYVNGAWLKNTEIPGEYGSYGSFIMLRERSDKQVREIIETAAANKSAKPGSDEKKIGDLYGGFMDEAAIEAAGAKPVGADLARIAAVKSRDEMIALWGALGREGLDTPYGIGIFPDLADSTRYVAYLGQSGLTLPDREYYLDQKNENFAKIRAAFPGYVEKMLTLGGVANAKEKASEIVALETKLAESMWAMVDRRDADKSYNPYEREKLTEVSDRLNWAGLLDSAGLSGQSRIVLAEKSYFTGLGKILGEVPLDTWKAWTQFKLIDGAAPYLSKTFVDARFDFRDKLIKGVTELPPRWKRGVRVASEAAGEAIGELYVAKYFPPESKKRMDALVKNLLASFDRGVDALDWMGPETRKAAKDKLSKFTVKIGYPDKWRDYGKLQIVRGDVLGNVKRANAFETDRQLAKLGQPIDRSEWMMTPQTVNAYYNPTMNEIVFPAAILQPPFFNPAADDAVNYGAIGGTIGHEISHGFDDQGSKFDGDGNKRMWWTDEDRKKFEERTKKLVAQFNGFETAGLHVNGQLTLGENIGDLSGLAIAYSAWKASLGGKPSPVIDGMTGDQRFFMGWAQVWKSKYRDKTLQQQIVSDPHSPAQFRILGPLRNIDAFETAFDVKPGDPMYLKPEERVKIW